MNTSKSYIIILGVVIIGIAACKNKTQNNETITGDSTKIAIKNVIADLKIDKLTSTIIWNGSDPATKHTGKVEIINGNMKFDEKGKLIGGTITVDMNSITVTDQTAEDKKPTLVKHLKSNDFFAVDSFPTSKFEISGVEQKEGNDYLIKGNFTIRGRVLGVEVPATVITKGGTTNVKANFSIDRTKWGVNYQSKTIDAKVKDKFINDMIELNVELNARK